MAGKKWGIFITTIIFCFQFLISIEIFEQINNDDLEAVKECLRSNPEFIEVEDSLGLSPLNYAVVHGKLEIIKYLYGLGARLDHGDNENSNPLHNASANGQLAVVEYLLSLGMDVNLADNNGNRALDFAAGSGNLELVALLIDHGADITVEDNYGGVAIHSAVYSGNLDLVKLLVEKGADINGENRWGVQPIHYAAWRGHTDILKYLISAGADINSTTTESGEIPLTWAMVAARFETADYLLANGSEINYKSPDGSTPIFAAYKSSLESIQYMLDKGADVNAADTTFTTALIRCGWSGDRNKINLLLDNGADINARNTWGQSILTHAIRLDSLETVRLLLEKGAKFEYNDCIGDACISMDGSALHQAVKLGSAGITSLLLEKGANIDFADLRYNRTPLHWTAIKGYTDIAEILINAGSDLNFKDLQDNTALHYAEKYHQADIVSLLKENNAAEIKLSKHDKADLLNRKLKDQEAAIWYLGHSGWGILTKNNFVIFDYWLWNRGPDQPCLDNGAIDPAQLKDKKVTVFVSHEHADHYDPRIWEWQEQIDNITYIFGFQPQLEQEQSYVFLPARTDTIVNDIKITTIESNDTGEGFLIEVDGVTILHPGDHANRQRDFSGTYLAEIDFLKAKNPDIDISFMPISGCGFGDQVAVKMGVYKTIEKLRPKTFFPMHSIGAEYNYTEFIEQMEADQDYDVQSEAATNIGDRFFYKKGKIKA